MSKSSSSHAINRTSMMCGTLGTLLRKHVNKAARTPVRRQPTLAEALSGKGIPELII